jgi:hypothetical protein
VTAVVDETGRRYGRLLVLRRGASYQGGEGRASARWTCRCDCGREVEVLGYRLRSGKTKSCGCFKADLARDLATAKSARSQPMRDRITRYRALGLTWEEVGKLVDLKPDTAYELLNRYRERTQRDAEKLHLPE